MSALTLDVIGEVAFSHNFGALQALQDWAARTASEDEGTQHSKQQQHHQHELAPISDPLIQALQESLKISGLVVVLAVLNLTWIERYLNPKSGRTRKLLNEAVDNVIRNARAKETTGGPSGDTKKKSLLQVLFQAKDTATQDGQDKKTLSDVELRDETKTFIVAGHETTSTWCYWAMYALAKFPDVQERLYEEVSKPALDTTSTVTLEQVDTMPYLSAFFCRKCFACIRPLAGFFDSRRNQKNGKVIESLPRQDWTFQFTSYTGILITGLVPTTFGQSVG
jgi:cytochrome P450